MGILHFLSRFFSASPYTNTNLFVLQSAACPRMPLSHGKSRADLLQSCNVHRPCFLEWQSILLGLHEIHHWQMHDQCVILQANCKFFFWWSFNTNSWTKRFYAMLCILEIINKISQLSPSFLILCQQTTRSISTQTLISQFKHVKTQIGEIKFVKNTSWLISKYF